MKSYRPYLILLIGEFLLIFSFLHFGSNTPNNVLFLNICVSSIIYFLLSSSILFPILDLKEKAQSGVASIGINWFISIAYTICAIILMLFFSITKNQEYKIETQILIHFILLFFLLVGGFISNKASEKVAEVYHEQKLQRNNLIEIQNLTKKISSRIELMSEISPEFKFKVNKIIEDLRFISPSNSIDANDIENKLKAIIVRIDDMLYNYENNKENIKSTLVQCEQLIKERKQVYSI
jgi:hypothetical protein